MWLSFFWCFNVLLLFFLRLVLTLLFRFLFFVVFVVVVSWVSFNYMVSFPLDQPLPVLLVMMVS